jgi:hypothetical protein
MGTSWANFKEGVEIGIATTAVDGILYLTKLLKDLGTWLVYIMKMGATAPIRGLVNMLGGDTSKFEARLNAGRDAGYAENQGDYRGDVAVNHAKAQEDFQKLHESAELERSMNAREAQLNQSGSAEGPLRLGPGVPTIVAQNVGVPDYMTQGRSYVDKSVTTIQLAVGSTDAQAKAVGAAVAKVRAAGASNRAAVNALEPAVE